MELDLELTDEEVEYLILKYIRDQTLMGRTEIPVSEIYEYLSSDMPEDAEIQGGFAVLTTDALQYIAEYEEKNRKRLN